jgi:hypothetical protein
VDSGLALTVLRAVRLTNSVPIVYGHLHRAFLPQPDRYKVEMELSLALLLVFAVRPLFARIPKPVKVCLVFLLLALAGERIRAVRKFAKTALAPVDVTGTIEYRTAIWVRDRLPGVRVMMSGSHNQVQQRAKQGIYNGGETAEEDARVSIAWLKAFGTGAIVVSGPKRQETWRGFGHLRNLTGAYRRFGARMM